MRYWLIVGWFMLRDYFEILLLAAVLVGACVFGVVVFEKRI